MPINERTLSHIGSWQSSGAGWFAARQPGILRFLGDRLSGDALALGLAAARQISVAFERHEGLRGPSLASTALERAEELAHRDVLDRLARGPYAERQAALIKWIAQLLVDPPVLLSREERRDIGMALVAVVYAFEAMSLARVTAA